MKEDLIQKELKTNQEIAQEAVESGLLDDCIMYQFKKIRKNEPWKLEFSGDLKNDIYLVLYEYDNAKLNDAYSKGHLNALITRIIINNLYSNSSNFYCRYLKFARKTNELTDVRDDTEQL